MQIGNKRLWKPWIFEFGYPDWALKQAKGKIVIGKIGILPVPVHLTIEYKNVEIKTINHSAIVWKDWKTEIRVPD